MEGFEFNYNNSFATNMQQRVANHEDGYLKQRMKNNEFINFTDRTQSIDTFATGIESNLSPYDNMRATSQAFYMSNDT